LISTLLSNACATRINVPIVKLRGSFSIAEIFGALISAFAASFVWLRFSSARSFAIRQTPLGGPSLSAVCAEGWGCLTLAPVSSTQAPDPTDLNRPPFGMRSWSYR
jgi:hypothetical protein